MVKERENRRALLEMGWGQGAGRSECSLGTGFPLGKVDGGAGSTTM